MNLHNYQQKIVNHILEHPSCGIFVEMGLGKTIAALTAVSRLLYDSLEVNRVLVIAPLYVAENVWPAEAAKWKHTAFLKLALVTGTQVQRVKALNTKADLYIINRENVTWLTHMYTKNNWPFDMVVIDELSSFKSPKAQRFKALKRVLPQVKRLVGLTGTPAPNGLIDLWSQVFLLDKGARLGTRLTEFRDRYFVPGARNGAIVYDYKLRPGADRQINKAIADICISMKSADYLELPDRIEHYVKVRLPEAVLKRYREFESTLVMSQPEITAVNAAVLSGKLRQFANGAIYDEEHNYSELHSCKLEALKELVEQANGQPVLVFYEFRHDLARILNALKEYQPGTICNEVLKEWNEGKVQVLLAHPASAGHGLNLQHGGNIIIWFGVDWSLELYQQANARLHRQGQNKPVNIYHLVTENTLDEAVIKSLARKEKGQENLLKAIKELRENR